MKPPNGKLSNESYDPEQFLKCPQCHRCSTVSVSLHMDGDVSFECSACDARAMGFRLHQSDRQYGGVND